MNTNLIFAHIGDQNPGTNNDQEQGPDGTWLVELGGKNFLGEKASSSDVLQVIKRSTLRRKTGTVIYQAEEFPLWKIYNHVQEKGGWEKVKVSRIMTRPPCNA